MTPHSGITPALAVPALAVVLAVTVAAHSSRRSGPEGGDDGRTLFEIHCESCHASDGGGTKNGPPPLRDSAWVTGPETRLIKIVLHGLRGSLEVNGKAYNLEMPGFANVLTDEGIADLISFVRRSWGSPEEPVSPESVRRVRASNRNRTDYWTAAELLQNP